MARLPGARWSALPVSTEFLEQRLRLDEVARVEALGKRRVDRREQLAPLSRAAAVAEEAGEGDGRAQLVRPRALPARDGEGVAEDGLDLGRAGALARAQLGAAAERVGAPDLLARHGALGLRERGERPGDVARPRLRVGEEIEAPLEHEPLPGREETPKALA